ncbi:MAG: zinc-ribbon domain-containing protein [Promethearchaeota archaeon]
MPRGGGGGFRGGGFSGGGFRGGGFRGGSSSFRSYSGRSSGRPFGRTGARRTVNSSSRGPYRHNYYRPHRSYWGYRHYWPWYRRWWYSPWFWGYHYRPWYYSPVYVGGGIIFAILMALIVLPIFGIAIAFPFSSADISGNINYRSTETLYFNEYWYEYEYIEEGNQISYAIQSSPAVVSFAIWDSSFESLPKTTEEGTVNYSFTLTRNNYEYRSFFMRPGSEIDWEYNADNPIEFFIVDSTNFNRWNMEQYTNYIDNKHDEDSTNGIGTVTINIAKDYYLIWYNEDNTLVNINYTIDYSAAQVIDLDAADFTKKEIDSLSGTFDVPNSGNWYFFVYFDPMDSPQESTDITFDVTYTTGVSSDNRWVNLRPILIGIGVVVIIIIIAAVFARSSQKKMKAKTKTKTKAESKAVSKDKTTDSTPKIPSKTSTCIRCGSKISERAKFCPVCGGKVEGRNIGKPITVPKAKICTYCGNKLSKNAKFCAGCGAKVEK